MQSGITASQQLHDAFKELVSTPDTQRGLVAGIEKEQLVPVRTLALGDADFFADLSGVQDALKDNEAAYVILRRHADAPDGFVAVTYVPDTAPVRQKMLFAATRLTLVRELGAERFRDTLFATTKAELTAAGWKKHDQHGQLQAPLTEEERTLQSVREAEAEASRSTGARKELVQTKGFKSPISAQGMDALKALPGSEHNLVQLRIDTASESIELVGTSSSTIDALSSALSTTEPRYSFFRYNHTHEGAEQSPVVFVSSCPSGTKVKERMMHAASRAACIHTVTSEAGLDVEKRIEVSDPSEITAAGIHEEFHPKTEQKTSFARPKRPGRK